MRWRVMLVKVYTKEELKSRTYETLELEIDELLPYLSDWMVDYIIQNSHFNQFTRTGIIDRLINIDS